MSLNSILQKYRSISFSERDKGERFERLMQAYSLTDPMYASQFKNVWMWDEFPFKDDLGGKDRSRHVDTTQCQDDRITYLTD